MESRYDHWIRSIKLAGINTLFKVNCVEWEDEWIPMKASRERERERERELLDKVMCGMIHNMHIDTLSWKIVKGDELLLFLILAT